MTNVTVFNRSSETLSKVKLDTKLAKDVSLIDDELKPNQSTTKQGVRHFVRRVNLKEDIRMGKDKKKSAPIGIDFSDLKSGTEVDMRIDNEGVRVSFYSKFD